MGHCLELALTLRHVGTFTLKVVPPCPDDCSRLVTLLPQRNLLQ